MASDMRKNASPAAVSLAVAGLILLHPSFAHAYIDPGSGSMLMQVLLSAVFGALFFARAFFGKVAAGVRRIFGGGGTEKTPPSEPPAA